MFRDTTAEPPITGQFIYESRVLYRDIKKHGKSEEFYLKALKIREEILSSKHTTIASLL